MLTARQTSPNVALSRRPRFRPRRVAGNSVAAALALGVAASAPLARAQAPLAEPASVSAGSGDAIPPPTTARTPEEIRVRKDVEVTATRGTLAEDTSAAATAEVSRAEFEKRGPRTVDQALVGVGGVTTFRARGLPDNGVGVGLRGFSGRSSGQGRVLVLLDGQPLNDPYLGAVNWNAVQTEEIERVEVVRGPFSALYGGNAMGGVVNVLTRPVVGRTFEAFGQYGTHETGTFSVRYADRLSEKLALSVGYQHLRTGGYAAQDVTRTATVSTPSGGTQVTGVEKLSTSTGGTTWGVGLRGDNWYRQHAFRARLDYSFTPTTELSLQLFRSQSETGWDDYSSSVRGPDGATIDSGNVVFDDGGTWRKLTLAPSQFLGALQGGETNTYQALLRHEMSGSGEIRVQAGVVDSPLLWTSLPGTGATLDGGPGTYTEQDFLGAFANLQWGRRLSPAFAVVAGSDTRLDQATVRTSLTTDYLGRGGSEVTETFSAGKALSQGLYSEGRITLAPSLRLTAGVRWDYWSTYDGVTKSAVAQPTLEKTTRSQDALTAKVGALYEPLAGTALRASVGTAFRSPSIFELYRDLLDAGTFLVGNPDLVPEEMLAWEVGVTQRLGASAKLDATYYENRIRDLIYRATDLELDPTGKTRRMLNAGRGFTRGAEIGASFSPWPFLEARAAYNYTDAKITENDLVPATVGKRIPFVPVHGASASVTASFRRFDVGAAVRYQSDIYSTETNTDVVNGVPGSYDPFLEVDASLNVRVLDPLTVSLTVENLFDEETYMFYRNPGRSVFVGLRIRLGDGSSSR